MNLRPLLKWLMNPLTEYLYFVLNCIGNSLKFKSVSQEYLSLVLNSEIGSYVRVFRRAVVSRSKVGSYSYIGEGSTVIKTSLGKFCCVGPGCVLGPGLHPTRSFVSVHPAFYSTRKQVGMTFVDRDYWQEQEYVIVGNDVWIGTNVIVLAGVTIGDGAVIGAGAVVTKDVPPYAVFGGVPAKLIRNRFDKETVDYLMQFRWWDKDLEWLEANALRFHDIAEFVRFTGTEESKNIA